VKVTVLSIRSALSEERTSLIRLRVDYLVHIQAWKSAQSEPIGATRKGTSGGPDKGRICRSRKFCESGGKWLEVCLLGLPCDPEDGGGGFLRDFGKLQPDYTASHLTGWGSE
jgi:hypothetical protein